VCIQLCDKSQPVPSMLEAVGYKRGCGFGLACSSVSLLSLCQDPVSFPLAVLLTYAYSVAPTILWTTLFLLFKSSYLHYLTVPCHQWRFCISDETLAGLYLWANREAAIFSFHVFSYLRNIYNFLNSQYEFNNTCRKLMGNNWIHMWNKCVQRELSAWS
jgi:hypothetical protein